MDYRILWLDINSSDPISSFREKLVDTSIFDDVHSSVDYVKSHPHEEIYLIVSGSFAKEIVPQIYDYSNVIEIFVFCGSIINYAEWSMDYLNKVMLFDHGDDLLIRLWNDVSARLRDKAALLIRHAEECKKRALQYKNTGCC